ncbi:Cyclin-K isoform 1, variant 2 [Balamuthia mandrillaris]
MQADALPVGEQDRIGQQRVVCAFMQEAGMKLKLPQLSIATAIVFFHRFYANCSWTEYDPYVTCHTSFFPFESFFTLILSFICPLSSPLIPFLSASPLPPRCGSFCSLCSSLVSLTSLSLSYASLTPILVVLTTKQLIGTTCLFLAGKVEETPKKLRDVLLVTHHLRYKVELKPQAPESTKLREQILLYERIVLQNIAFNLTVEHPYKYLLSFVKSIQGDQNLAQVAWNFVNDSLRTTLCLQYEPKLIAIAAIYLASKFLNYKLPEADNKPWWEDLGFKIEDLDHVSNQILDLYDSQTPEGGGASSESGVNSDGPSEVNEKQKQKEKEASPSTSNGH